jgi:hypothetical protein
MSRRSRGKDNGANKSWEFGATARAMKLMGRESELPFYERISGQRVKTKKIKEKKVKAKQPIFDLNKLFEVRS